jgi:carbon storage regulator
MLVITRKPGEKICLGDDVTITVLEVVGSAVRLGSEAPAEIPVYRYEIWAAVKEENRAAADASITNLPSSKNRSTKSS